jgi:hypothetical protein
MPVKKLIALLAFALAADLAAAGVARADVPPPPPPKGKKYASVKNEVRLDKGVTGYAFVERVSGFGPGARVTTFRKVELSSEKAVAMAAGGRRTSVNLLAIPHDEAKAYKTDAELFDALKANRLKSPALGFNSTAIVPDAVRGDSVKWTYTITGIDGTKIKAKVEGEGSEQTKPRPGKKDAPGDEGEDAPVASPRGAAWVAGAAAALGVMLGGLWLAGRARRKA